MRASSIARCAVGLAPDPTGLGVCWSAVVASAGGCVLVIKCAQGFIAVIAACVSPMTVVGGVVEAVVGVGGGGRKTDTEVDEEKACMGRRVLCGLVRQDEFVATIRVK